jgi:hypothetical protein
MTHQRRQAWREDARGVVYLETLVAFMPVFMFFLGTLQLADLSVAHLIVQHASSTAARAAVVVLPDDGAYYEDHENSQVHQYTGLRRADVELAADLVMQASPRLSLTSVELDKQSYTQRDDLTATVKARYQCLIATFCGAGIALESKSQLVYQGAQFIYEPTTVGEVVSVHRPTSRPRNGGTPGDGTPGTPGNGTPGAGTPGTPDPNGSDTHGQQPGGGTPRGTDPSDDHAGDPSNGTHPSNGHAGDPSSGTNPSNGHAGDPSNGRAGDPSNGRAGDPSNGRAGDPSNRTDPSNGTNPNGQTTTPPNRGNPNSPVSRPGGATEPRQGTGQVGTPPGQSPGAPSTIGNGRAPDGPIAASPTPGRDSRPSDGQNTGPVTAVPPAGIVAVLPGRRDPETDGQTGPVADSTKPPAVGVGSGSPRGPPGQDGTPGRTPAGNGRTNGSSLPLPVAGRAGVGPIASGPACLGPSCASGTGACFVAGTLVGTPSGSRSIESIVAGESVYAYDEDRREVVVAEVTAAFDRKADTLVDLTVRSVAGGDEQVITATPDHPFYVPALAGYVPLGQLQTDAVLLTLDGVAARVVSARARSGEFVVFNFTVEGKHNYFVGALAAQHGILVHNACPPTPAQIRAGTRAQSANWRCQTCRVTPGTTHYEGVDYQTVPWAHRTTPVTRTAGPVPSGSTFIDGWPVPENTTRVTYSADVTARDAAGNVITDGAGNPVITNQTVNYYLDEHGRTIRVEAPWVRSNDANKKNVRSYVPGRGTDDDRGHLAAEGNAPAPFLVNVPENFIGESPESNQSVAGVNDNKRAWELELQRELPLRGCGQPGVSCVTSHEVVHEDSTTDPRPAGAYHSVYINGVKQTDLSWYVPNPP